MREDLALARAEFLASSDDALLPIVDAHHHFWDVAHNPHPWLTQRPRIAFRYGDYEAICRDFLPEDYARARGAHRVMRHVTMEGEWDPQDTVGEAVWMHGLALRTGVPHAMSAQIWLDRGDVAEVLRRYTTAPLAGFVRSVRHKPRSLPRQEYHAGWQAPGSMRCPVWRAGYARLAASGLAFELQVPWWHMGEAAELAHDFPATPIIVNHAGLPAQRDAASLAAWRTAMAALVPCANVRVKISGLGVAGQAWTADAQAPVVHTLIDLFGAGRCMFASNYPVDGLVGPLDTLWSGFKQLTRTLPPAQRLALFCDNAVAAYGLD